MSAVVLEFLDVAKRFGAINAVVEEFLLSVVRLVPAIIFVSVFCLIDRRTDMPGRRVYRGDLLDRLGCTGFPPGARNTVSRQECQEAIVALADLVNPPFTSFQ